jgi:hypothetical protein
VAVFLLGNEHLSYIEKGESTPARSKVIIKSG